MREVGGLLVVVAFLLSGPGCKLFTPYQPKDSAKKLGAAPKGSSTGDDAKLSRARTSQRSALEKKGDAAKRAGRTQQAFANYRAARAVAGPGSDKLRWKFNHAREAVVDAELRSAAKRLGAGDPIGALAILERLRATKELGGQLNKGTSPHKMVVNGVQRYIARLTSAMQFYNARRVAIRLDRALLGIFGDVKRASLKSFTNMHAVNASARAHFSARLGKVRGKWLRSFLKFSIALFRGDGHSGVAAARYTSTGSPACRKLLAKLKESVNRQAVGHSAHLSISLTACPTNYRTETRYRRETYYVQVPVWGRGKYKSKNVKVTDRSGGGQTSKCTQKDSHGRCKNWATVSGGPTKTRTREVWSGRVEFERVITHYRKEARTRSVPYKVKVLDSYAAHGNARVDIAGRSFPLRVNTTGKTVERLVELVAAPILNIIARSATRTLVPRIRRRIRTASAPLELEDALLEWAFVQRDHKSQIFFRRYGMRWSDVKDVMRARMPSIANEMVVKTYALALPDAESTDVGTKHGAAERSVKTKQDRVTAWAEKRRLALAADRMHRRDTLNEFYKYDDSSAAYWRQVGISLGLDVGTSPLIGTDLTHRVSLAMTADQLIYGFHLGVPFLGSESTSLGAQFGARLFNKGRRILSLAVAASYQSGASYAGNDPYHVFFGFRVGYAIPLGPVVFEPEVGLNLLQLAGSGGPEGLNRHSSFGMMLRLPVANGYWLGAGGAAYAGAHNALLWTVRLSFNNALKPVAELPGDR